MGIRTKLARRQARKSVKGSTGRGRQVKRSTGARVGRKSSAVGRFAGKAARGIGSSIPFVGGLVQEFTTPSGEVMSGMPMRKRSTKGLSGRDIKGALRVGKFLKKFGVKPKAQFKLKRRRRA